MVCLPFRQLPVKFTVEQFSPILPDNYKETSYPVALYNWYAENPSNKPVTVSILFSWTNMVGWFRDTSSNFNAVLNAQNKNIIPLGIAFGAERCRASSSIASAAARCPRNGMGSLPLQLWPRPGVEISYITELRSTELGRGSLAAVLEHGPAAEPIARSRQRGEQIAGAIAVRFTLAPKEKKLIPMSLSWDLPVVQFGGGRKWIRHYTRFFDASGTNAWKIARAALENDQRWSDQIDAWQKPYIEDDSKPAWYRGELFNELYIVADGGTLWAHEQGDPANPLHLSAKNADTFAYLECFDYSYYGTSDVRFYGSFPLIKFWPEIEKQEMRQYTDTIPETIPQHYLWAWKLEHDHTYRNHAAQVGGVRSARSGLARRRSVCERESVQLSGRFQLARSQQQVRADDLARLCVEWRK